MAKLLKSMKKLENFLPVTTKEILEAMSVAMIWDNAVDFYREIISLTDKELKAKEKTPDGHPINWYRSEYGHFMTLTGHEGSLKSAEISLPVNGHEIATVADLLVMLERFINIFPDSQDLNNWVKGCLTHDEEGRIRPDEITLGRVKWNFMPQPHLGTIHLKATSLRRAPSGQT